jgi:hypothetical protein
MKEDEMGGAFSMNGGDENVYTIFVGIPERKRPLVRSRCKWKVAIIKTYLR